MWPVIGICAYAEEASWGAWTAPAALIPLSYVRSVVRAGGRPMAIPPMEEAVDETLEALDGLIFSGGSDIDPDLYGADPHPATNAVRPLRDRAELALLERAIARDMPVLAICRGLEVLNVLRGGSIEQHLPDVVGHENHREALGVFSEHDVAVEPASRLGAIVGARVATKSHHHQGPGRVGEGLREVAWAEDGTVEGLEDPERRFVLGVLWHPEEDEEDSALFAALVAEARVFREGKGGG
jgi:gamma-glutamyl-gamma-aminobutyrate hydrolase PuuD